MKHFKLKLMSALCLSTLALVGCNNDNSSNNTSPTTTSVSGTAAVGSPIINAVIDLRCNGYSKNAAATTDAQGNWSANVQTANLPCATRLTGGTVNAATNTQTLYSITTGTGANVVVNITPLTDLILAKAVNSSAGNSLDSWFTGVFFSASLNDAVAKLAASIQSVLDELTAKGYTLPSGTDPFNPFSTSFTAATNNIYDQLLEQIGRAIAASSSQTYEQFKTNYLSGTSIPVAPTSTTTPPATTTPPTTTTPSTATCTAPKVAVTFSTTSSAPYTNGQQACASASSTSLTIDAKTLTNPTQNTAVTAPYAAYVFTEGTYQYEVILNNGALYEINLSNNSNYIGQFALDTSTCASQNKPKASSSDLAPFVGTYQVSINSSSVLTPFTIAANGDATLKNQTIAATDVCGPFVQSNGTSLLILAKNSANVQVSFNVFKDAVQGTFSAEGTDFTDTTGVSSFYGLK